MMICQSKLNFTNLKQTKSETILNWTKLELGTTSASACFHFLYLISAYSKYSHICECLILGSGVDISCPSIAYISDTYYNKKANKKTNLKQLNFLQLLNAYWFEGYQAQRMYLGEMSQRRNFWDNVQTGGRVKNQKLFNWNFGI